VILSHRHRFIFLKTRKTASTSVEIALGQICGPEDVVTDIGQDERFRIGPGPRNQRLPRGRWPIAAHALKLLGRSDAEAGVAFYNHIPAAKVRAMVPRAVWDGYLKISIERNPWDREVSQYYWRQRGPERPSFRDWVLDPKRRTIDNFEIYGLGDVVAADVVMRFETIASDFETLSARLALPLPPLPRLKASPVAGRLPYRELYDDETRDFVARRYAREIAAFGYAF
jgi:hypothetical protein